MYAMKFALVAWDRQSEETHLSKMFLPMHVCVYQLPTYRRTAYRLYYIHCIRIIHLKFS